jgi:hypothetical protein
MKKMFTIMFMMFGIMFVAQAQSPIIQLGKAIGELAIAPVGIAVGAVEGIADGVCESVVYLVTGESTSTTKTTITKTTYTQTAPVYVIPSQLKPEKNNINVVNSPGATVNVTEVNSSTTTTRTPTVIYIPSTRPSYYYYNPYQFRYP